MNTTTAFDINSPISFVDFFRRVLTADFMPHGHCYFFRPDVLWLNVVSDALIAVSYYMIPISLLYIAFKRRDFPFQKILVLFGAFIVACGTTHLFEIYTVWTGMYRMEGIIKFITAIISILTAFVFIPLLPKIVALPGLAALVKELTERKVALEKSNSELTQVYDLSSGREGRILQLKQEVNELALKLGNIPPYKTPLNEP
jgi:two-component system, NtrC family, sensor kinase